MSSATPQANGRGRGSRGRGSRGAGRGKPSNRGAAPARNASTLIPAQVPYTVVKPEEPEEPEAAPVLKKHLSDTKFQDFVTQGLLSKSIYFPFPNCTDVQAQTLPVILKGGDTLAQAKTGTGKTLAFMLPTIQNLLANPVRKGQIGALIISPTRELAAQIATATEPCIANLNMKVQIATGGTNQNSEAKRLMGGQCQILVATPGRLLDHLQNGGLRECMQDLKTLVLDEADRLLDSGFKRDIEAVISLLPDRRKTKRQSLLFSATLPPDVQAVARIALSPDHTFVSTIADDEQATHEHVPQSVAIAELPDFHTTLVSILKQEIANTKNNKIMIFLPTARSTGLVFDMLEKLDKNVLGLPVWEIHSRMSQSARNKSADAFKSASSGILVSSDVTARGMDFPLVTLVLQAGVPANEEQYIHRLGRTARAGAQGQGILLLCPFERFFLDKAAISALPLQPYQAQPQHSVDPNVIRRALSQVSEEAKGQAYGAWLGYMKGFGKSTKWSPPQLISMANTFAFDTCQYVGNGDGKAPPMEAKTIGKMGLKDFRNLFNVVSALPGREGGQRGGQSQRGGATAGRGGGRGRGRGRGQ